MKRLLVGFLFVGVFAASWVVFRRCLHTTSTIDDLHAAIDTSMLPTDARAEMHADLRRGITRPSQVDIGMLSDE